MHRISSKSSKRIDSDLCYSIMPFIDLKGRVGAAKVYESSCLVGKVNLCRINLSEI